MLCSAIAMASLIPSLEFTEVEMKVVIPSGMLWIIKTIIEIIPNLYSLLSEINLSTSKEAVNERIIPTTINIDAIMITGNMGNLSNSKKTDSGINEIRDIASIIPLEKARVKDRMVFWCFFFKRHGIIPSKVENPAKEVVKKLKIILFIVKIMLMSGEDEYNSSFFLDINCVFLCCYLDFN